MAVSYKKLASQLKASSIEERISILMERANERTSEAFKNSVKFARAAYTLSKNQPSNSIKIDAVNTLLSAFINHKRFKEFNGLLKEWELLILNDGDLKQRARLANIKATFLLNQSRFLQALECLKPWIDNDDYKPEGMALITQMINLSNIYIGIGMYDRAISKLYDILKLPEANSDNHLITITYSNIARAYSKLLQFNDALKYFNMAQEEAKKTGYSHLIAISINNYGCALFNLEKLKEALTYFMMALEQFKKINDMAGIRTTLTNIGRIHQMWKQYDEALNQYQKAMQLALEQNELHEISNLNKNIAEIYIDQNRLDKARTLLAEALKKARQIKAKDLQHDIYKSIIKLYEKIGDYRRAFVNLILLQRNREENILSGQRMNIEAIKIRYQVESSEKEAKILREKNAELVREITERKRLADEKEEIIKQLKEALTQIRVLSGLLPICANCKRIRDETGNWQPLEVYITKHSDAQFTHGLCPICLKEYLH